ncbi:MAG: prepilin-type N-terminal cleavage/methylation domain-containing protein [Candidatus Margulisbacteria bacterium]|nr:prepilin-type N-terminal cleavage/methylation domain-containing protein [Candidatus Margulisiibacteriota bacterium]
MNKHKKGFTLIEMIAAIVIAGIIASVFAVVINSGMDALIFMRGQKSGMADARSVMKRMVREIRKTKSASSTDILNFTVSYYRFRDTDDNVIGYQQVGSNLLRNGSVVLTDLASANGLSFSYFNSSGGTTVTAEAIRQVKISIIIEEGSNRVRLQSAAGIRNR